MTDSTTTPEDPRFETDETRADQASQQGLGLGARELEAQRDPNAIQAANAEDEDLENDQDDADPIDESIGVQGQAPSEAGV
ncbi:MAG: hypothetical protein ACK4FB_11705 [Brevundimonas sp.]|uniref:hypothetical protein n=1 Tax=Brevundimonas sp. TaxID=1871086 RepID=UPI00391AFBF2